MLSTEAQLTLLIVSVTLVAFTLGRWRLDWIALLSLSALLASGILTPEQAVSGFSDPLVIRVAGLLVVSAALLATGVTTQLGRFVGNISGGKTHWLLAGLMLCTALLSALMSTTATVAVMIPVVTSLARRSQLSPSLLLLPMVFAGSLGSTLTLIATPPNFVVSDELIRHGHPGFSFFSFTPIGAALVGVGVLFLTLWSKHALARHSEQAPAPSEPSLQDLLQSYRLDGRIHRLKISPENQLGELSLRDLAWQHRFQITALALTSSHQPERRWRRVPRGDARAPRELTPDTHFHIGDELLIQGRHEDAARLAEAHGLTLLPPGEEERSLNPEQLGMVELLIAPSSSLTERSLLELGFREHFHAQVIAIRRHTSILREQLPNLKLRAGDILLVQGPPEALNSLKHNTRDFIVLSAPSASEFLISKKAPLALLIVCLMISCIAFNWLPFMVATIFAALALVLSGCLRLDQAYEAVQLRSLVLIAAMLPLATALQETGAVQFISEQLISICGNYSPHLIYITLFLTTAAITQAISNTTSALIMAPIAFETAKATGLSPEPLMLGVALAASCTFITPVSSPGNMLVLHLGRYQTKDFVRVGGPLFILVLLISSLLVPYLYPFH